MKGLFGVAIVIPGIIALWLGAIGRAVREWEYGELFSWSLFMVVMFGIWFPFVLLPYLKRARKES